MESARNFEIKNNTGKPFLKMVYGDTDSVVGDVELEICDKDGNKKRITIKEWFDANYKNNNVCITPKGSELLETSDKILNWNDKLDYVPVKYIMRHKVSKPKWRLKTKSGKEVIITEDHSLIVFRDGMEIQVKPDEVKINDKILTIS